MFLRFEAGSFIRFEAGSEWLALNGIEEVVYNLRSQKPALPLEMQHHSPPSLLVLPLCYAFCTESFLQ